MEIRSKNLWEVKIEDTQEIKLSMLSIAEKYGEVEVVFVGLTVTKLSS
jgi:hypothetical protein